jgi:hypothetical protein
MLAPGGVFGDIIDNDRLAALADFMADRRFDLQFAAGLEPEVDFIEHAACDPAILGHACNRGEPHPGCAAHYVKDCWNRFYAAYRLNVGPKI